MEVTSNCTCIAVCAAASFLEDPDSLAGEISFDSGKRIARDWLLRGSEMSKQFAKIVMAPFGGLIANRGCFSRPDEILRAELASSDLARSPLWECVFKHLGFHGSTRHELVPITDVRQHTVMKTCFEMLVADAKRHGPAHAIAYFVLLDGKTSTLMLRWPKYYHFDSHFREIVQGCWLVEGWWPTGGAIETVESTVGGRKVV